MCGLTGRMLHGNANGRLCSRSVAELHLLEMANGLAVLSPADMQADTQLKGDITDRLLLPFLAHSEAFSPRQANHVLRCSKEQICSQTASVFRKNTKQYFLEGWHFFSFKAKGVPSLLVPPQGACLWSHQGLHHGKTRAVSEIPPSSPTTKKLVVLTSSISRLRQLFMDPLCCDDENIYS